MKMEKAILEAIHHSTRIVYSGGFAQIVIDICQEIEMKLSEVEGGISWQNTRPLEQHERDTVGSLVYRLQTLMDVIDEYSREGYLIGMLLAQLRLLDRKLHERWKKQIAADAITDATIFDRRPTDEEAEAMETSDCCPQCGQRQVKCCSYLDAKGSEKDNN